MWNNTDRNFPNLSLEDFLSDLLNGMSRDFQERFNAVLPDILLNQSKYKMFMGNGDSIDDGDFSLLGNLTKKEMVNLYKKRLVSKPSPANESEKRRREIYDMLLLAGKYKGYCSYCLVNTANQLDHFLPKELFCILSVEPYNLVPSCGPCNLGKLTSWSSKPHERFFHPYFDEKKDLGIWLTVKIVDTSPIKIDFFPVVNSKVSSLDAQRIQYEFKTLKLNETYQKAASKLLSRLFNNKRISTLDDISYRSYFQEEAREHRESLDNQNCYEAAVCDALSSYPDRLSISDVIG